MRATTKRLFVFRNFKFCSLFWHLPCLNCLSLMNGLRKALGKDNGNVVSANECLNHIVVMIMIGNLIFQGSFTYAVWAFIFSLFI